MAAKKYYAVKKGKTTGLFSSWDECRAQVEGYPGAEYRGFAGLEEARAYLGMTDHGKPDMEAEGPEGASASGSAKMQRISRAGVSRSEDETVPEIVGFEDETMPKTAEPGDCPPPGTLLAYVDGSYDHSLRKYAFGCVFIPPDGRIRTQFGNGDNEQSLQHRNVTGEMLGAMYAVRVGMMSGFSRIEIRYDYEGIEKWVTGAWRSKTELTGKYARSMRQWGEQITICFTKVAAHSNVYYNELADKMAKTGLREGNGIPKVCPLEEMRNVEGEVLRQSVSVPPIGEEQSKEGEALRQSVSVPPIGERQNVEGRPGQTGKAEKRA